MTSSQKCSIKYTSARAHRIPLDRCVDYLVHVSDFEVSVLIIESAVSEMPEEKTRRGGRDRALGGCSDRLLVPPSRSQP